MELYQKLIDEAATIPQIATVKLVGLGEPMLDPKLLDRIKYARRALSRDRVIEVFTNGFHLTPAKFDAMQEAGLGCLVVSLNAVRPEQHAKIMGVPGKFEQVCASLEYAIEHRGGMHIEVHAVANGDQFPYEDVEPFIRKWGDTRMDGYGICVMEGNWTSDTRTIRERKFTPNEACHRALSQIYVTYDGLSTTCCFDPTGKQVFGNFNDHTIREVYNGVDYLTFREDHANNRADKYDICRNCTRI